MITYYKIPSYIPDITGCPYKDLCTGYPHKCRTCQHNPRRDYYTPTHTQWTSTARI